MFWFFWPRGRWDLSSLTQDPTGTSCIGRQSLNYQNTREVLAQDFEQSLPTHNKDLLHPLRSNHKRSEIFGLIIQRVHKLWKQRCFFFFFNLMIS